MNNDTDAMRSINTLLQGEYMAIESFNNFISRLEDGNVKNTFQDIQKQHRGNVDILATYIQNAGGQPDENLGIKGIMGDIKLNLDLSSQSDAKEVIKKAIEGETKGVNMAEKVLRGKLDDKSRKLAGEILENDRESIEKLKNLLL
ncbi:MAG: DUF2383 domain-containing protein [Eubacteriales bacterium]|nr:DUF2383 domain-containing protein [Eubacteriales bacterium]